jgi:hypothetical protein
MSRVREKPCGPNKHVEDTDTDISDPTETIADTTADAPSDTDDRDSAASDGGDTESADTA